MGCGLLSLGREAVLNVRMVLTVDLVGGGVVVVVVAGVVVVAFVVVVVVVVVD